MKRSSRTAVPRARVAFVLLTLAFGSACRETVAPPNSTRLIAGLRQSIDLASLETFYGPERFTGEGDGNGNHSQLVTRTISTDQFEAPFVLHVRNGTDGSKLVKQATVEFDGVILLDKHSMEKKGPTEWSFPVNRESFDGLHAVTEATPQLFG